MILCAGCQRPVIVLAGDERPTVDVDGETRPVCADCHRAALRTLRQREATAERVRRHRDARRLVRDAFGHDAAALRVTPDDIKAARIKVGNRLRKQRQRVRRRTMEAAARHAPDGATVTPIVIRRHYRGADLTGFVDPPPEREIRLPEPRPEDRECVLCGRSLNLGRYKTEGDTCGTCKRERRMRERERAPWYVTPEELARQLEDDSPLPEDDDDE